MAKIAPVLGNFTMGELAPTNEGNVMMPGYFNGAKAIRNAHTSTQGYVTKRQGTKYLATTKWINEAVKLIPFEHSSNDTYMLEFGGSYIRFYTEGEAVTATYSGIGTIPYEIVSPYASAHVPDLKYVNSADTTYITHPLYPPQKLVRNNPVDGNPNWTITTVVFDPPAFLDQNTSDTLTLTPTAITGNIGIDASGNVFLPEHVGGYFMFSGPDTRSGNVNTDPDWVGTISVDEADAVTWTVDGTWAGTITTQRSFDQGVTWTDLWFSTTNGGQYYTNEQDDTQYRIGFKTGDHTSGSADVTVAKVGEYGTVVITQVVDPLTASGTVMRELPGVTATSKWSEGAWSDYRGYPIAATFYEQRLVLAGSEYEPQKLWGSQVDSYENFETGIADSDSWAYQLADQNINRVKWLSPGKVLLIGTSGSEWRFGSKDTSTTPSNVEAWSETDWGSSAIDAIRVGNVVLFIQRGSTILRAMIFDWRSEDWVAHPISKKAEHLMEDGIKAMAFTSRPETMLWMITNSGDLVTVTILTNVDSPIFAFHKYDTQGCFDDIAVIAGVDRDEVWVSVKRLVNGVPAYYIEQFQTADWEEPFAVFVDDRVLPVTFTPAPGTYYSGRFITMSCGTPGARIFYTTNGTTPSEENGYQYLMPIWLDTTTTLMARAFI